MTWRCQGCSGFETGHYCMYTPACQQSLHMHDDSCCASPLPPAFRRLHLLDAAQEHYKIKQSCGCCFRLPSTMDRPRVCAKYVQTTNRPPQLSGGTPGHQQRPDYSSLTVGSYLMRAASKAASCVQSRSLFVDMSPPSAPAVLVCTALFTLPADSVRSSMLPCCSVAARPVSQYRTYVDLHNV